MHKSRKHSGKRIWSAWGDWIWSSSQSRYYQQRQDNYGELETRWGPSYEGRGAARDDVPRRGGEREDDLVESLQNTHLDDEDELADEDDEAGYSHGGPAAAAYSTTHGVSSSKKRGKGKGKGKEQYHDSEEDGDYDTRDIGYGASQPLEETEYDDRPEDDAYYSRRTKSAHSSSRPGRNPASSRHYDQEFEVDSDSVDAVEPDRNNYTLGGSSSTPVEGTYADDPSEMTTEPNDYISSANSPEDAADLDPRYRIEPSHRFQPGEVFKILWPEPSGRSTGKLPTLSDKREVPDRYGGSIFVGFRRFIVVASDSGHCTCVPISTYGGKGCKKKGIKPEKHGIITEKGTKAKRLDGEPKLGYPPVRMKITVHSEQIARESRVNYSKLVTIEHNVKVFFIGSIYADDYDLVTDAVNDCWEKKTFYKKKH